MMKTAAKPFSVEAKEMSRRGRDVEQIIAPAGRHVKKNLRNFHFGRFIQRRINLANSRD